MFTDPFAHHGQHPDVNAALAAQEKRARIDTLCQVEPEPDLRQVVRELAEIVGSGILAHLIGGTIQERRRNPRNEGAREDEMILRQMRDDVREIARRLRGNSDGSIVEIER